MSAVPRPLSAVADLTQTMHTPACMIFPIAMYLATSGVTVYRSVHVCWVYTGGIASYAWLYGLAVESYIRIHAATLVSCIKDFIIRDCTLSVMGTV